MAELECQFHDAGFDIVAVQEGRMSSQTTLKGERYTMYMFPGVDPAVREAIRSGLDTIFPDQSLS